MEAFYSQWLVEQERLLNELLSVPRDRPDLQTTLISRMLAHCAEYYDVKSQLAQHDIFQVYSALWLTPIERSFHWLGGLEPGMILSFVPGSLTDDQRRKIEELKMQMVKRQTELEASMREVEETMMALMALAAIYGYVRNGEARGEVALRVPDMMRALFDEADKLRKHVVYRIISILDTAQTALFLVSVANFHVSLRRYSWHIVGAYWTM